MTLILVLLTAIPLLFGILAGIFAAKVIFQEKPIGSLRVDDSDPDSGPYLFLELDPDGADAIYKQRYVRLRVPLMFYGIRYGYDYQEIQDAVNKILNGSVNEPDASKEMTSSCKPEKFDADCAGEYVTTANLYCRNDAGTNKKAICKIPVGTAVRCYGYYSLANDTKWLYIQFTLNGVTYTGFSSSEYLTNRS